MDDAFTHHAGQCCAVRGEERENEGHFALIVYDSCMAKKVRGEKSS